MTNDRSNFPRFTYGHQSRTRRILIAKIPWNRATKQSAFTSPLSPTLRLFHPTNERCSVAWRWRSLHACKTRALYPVYAHSSNAWPLSCWCNQNEIREREKEREGGKEREREMGCTSVKINNMSLKMHLLVRSYRECRSASSICLSLSLSFFYRIENIYPNTNRILTRSCTSWLMRNEDFPFLQLFFTDS